MTLDDYLSQETANAARLAESARTTTASINRILHGEQQPSADMIRAIVEATGGKVTADDLVFGQPRQRKAKAA